MQAAPSRERPIPKGTFASTEAARQWLDTVSHLVGLSEEQLSALDIAALNLFCALGLNGSEGLDPQACCRQVDAWAKKIRDYTQWCMPTYHSAPAEFEYCLPYFLIHCMVWFLQKYLGVHYYKPFNEGEYNASDSRNLFIHGILSGHGGTCQSLPVLYVAIGRRLGYPLCVVRTKYHLFVRWEGSGERFNFDATSGYKPCDDKYYEQFPVPLSESELSDPFFMRNLTRKHELAEFLSVRGNCLHDNLGFGEALRAYQMALHVDPNHRCRERVLIASILRTAIAEALRTGPQTPRVKLDLRTLPLPEPVLEFERSALAWARKELDRIIKVTGQDFINASRRVGAASKRSFTMVVDVSEKGCYEQLQSLDGPRTYDPTIGRWDRVDPSGLKVDTDPYRYCDNDPTNEVDPTGDQGVPNNPGGPYDFQFNPPATGPLPYWMQPVPPADSMLPVTANDFAPGMEPAYLRPTVTGTGGAPPLDTSPFGANKVNDYQNGNGFGSGGGSSSGAGHSLLDQGAGPWDMPVPDSLKNITVETDKPPNLDFPPPSGTQPSWNPLNITRQFGTTDVHVQATPQLPSGVNLNNWNKPQEWDYHGKVQIEIIPWGPKRRPPDPLNDSP